MPFDSSPWPCLPLGSLCKRPEQFDPRRVPDRVFRYVDIASICNRARRIVESKAIVGAEAPSRARKRIHKDDVLFATTRPYLRSIAKVPAELDGEVCSTGLCVIRATSAVLPEWLFFGVQCNDFLDQIAPKMRGASYPAVTDRDVYDAVLPVPPLSEQRRIVARIQECLARVEEAQRLQHLALKELDAVLPAYLSELEQSLECPRVAVKELVVSTQNGRSIRSNGDSGNGRVLTLSAVRTPTLDLSAAKTVELDCRTAQNYAIYKGDVFVSRSNTSELVGLAAVANCDGPTNTIYPDLLIRLKPRIERVAPSYLAQALRFPSSRRQIRACAKGTSQSMVKISGAELREVTIPLPALADQEKIVAKIEAIQATCGGLSKALSLNPQALADAVLKKAFAGEL